MIKSSWNKLIEELKANGLMYLGSRYCLTVGEVADLANKAEEIAYKCNRTYKQGVTSIAMITERDTTSYLDKSGSVYTMNNIFVIIDGKTTIFYKRGSNLPLNT